MPSTKSFLFILLLASISLSTFSQKYPEMVKVEGGTFLMGDVSIDLPLLSTKWHQFKNGKTRMLNIEGDLSKLPDTVRKFLIMDFNVSKLPVSVEQYRAYCFSMGFAKVVKQYQRN